MNRNLKLFTMAIVVFQACSPIVASEFNPALGAAPAIIQGTVGLANHSGKPIKGLLVQLQVGSSIVDYDYTDWNGHYYVTTPTLSSSASARLIFTCRKTGFYTNDWCKPALIVFTVSPGGSYTKNMNVLDNTASKTKMHTLKFKDPLSGSVIQTFSLNTYFYINYKWNWDSSHNCYTVGSAEIKLYKWTCTISSARTGPVTFNFQCYDTYWPFTPDHMIYETSNTFVRTNGVWNSLSKTCNVVNYDSIWISDMGSFVTWTNPTATAIGW